MNFKKIRLAVLIAMLVLTSKVGLAQDPSSPPTTSATAGAQAEVTSSPTFITNAPRQFTSAMPGSLTNIFPGFAPADQDWQSLGGCQVFSMNRVRNMALGKVKKGVVRAIVADSSVVPYNDDPVRVNCDQWSAQNVVGAIQVNADAAGWPDLVWLATGLSAAKGSTHSRHVALYGAQKRVAITKLRSAGLGGSGAGVPGDAGVAGAAGTGFGTNKTWTEKFPKFLIIELDDGPFSAPPQQATAEPEKKVPETLPQTPPPQPAPQAEVQPPPSTQVPSERVIHHVLEGEATLNVRVSGQVQLLAPPAPPEPKPRQNTSRRAQHKACIPPPISVHLEHGLFATHVKVTGGSLTSLDEKWGTVTFDVTGAPSCP